MLAATRALGLITKRCRMPRATLELNWATFSTDDFHQDWSSRWPRWVTDKLLNKPAASFRPPPKLPPGSAWMNFGTPQYHCVLVSILVVSGKMDTASLKNLAVRMNWAEMSLDRAWCTCSSVQL